MVPRIDAPTLREHRERRRALLLAAGRDLAREHGPRGVTMAAVAGRAGLSRPAVYEYFASTDTLLGELLLDQMRGWTSQVAAAVGRARTPQGRVRAYIRSSIEFISEGGHALADAVDPSTLPSDLQKQLSAAHDRIQEPLEGALAELGESNPHRTATYVQGMVETARRRITAGARPSGELRAIEAFVLGSAAR